MYKRQQSTPSGLYYKITKTTNGIAPKAGDQVSVHYAGRLVDGSEFDSSFKRNQPIDIPIGMGQVIKGWDEGILLLKEGETATLLIPSELGYGARGAGGVIPPNAWLVFDVESVSYTHLDVYKRQRFIHRQLQKKFLMV